MLRSLVPDPKVYRLFISHAWKYDDEYRGLVALLESDVWFHWQNLSIPEDEPLVPDAKLPKSCRYLVKQIDKEVEASDCLLVLSGMYACHSQWIQSEIEAAKDFGKPILAIAPRGQERFPTVVTDSADLQAAWNSSSIISAIRDLVPGTLSDAIARAMGALPPRASGLGTSPLSQLLGERSPEPTNSSPLSGLLTGLFDPKN